MLTSLKLLVGQSIAVEEVLRTLTQFKYTKSHTVFTPGEFSQKGEVLDVFPVNFDSPIRIILNFETKDVKGEFSRIKALGTTVIAEPYEMSGAWIATLADPDGNYFQLLSPWKPKV